MVVYHQFGASKQILSFPVNKADLGAAINCPGGGVEPFFARRWRRDGGVALFSEESMIETLLDFSILVRNF